MQKANFSRYDIFVIAILTILQFTLILDFMVLSPLGPFLIPDLKITTDQFTHVVSAYAISAGLSGILAAGFADKYDRKKLLMFFYIGFIGGTLFCGLANSYHALMAARIVTGIFGGVIGSISFAIITDLFRLEVRGRVMGFVQMAFASSQVLGLPIGLYLANRWNWHAPFIMIVIVSVVVAIVVMVYLKPIDAHLNLHAPRNAFKHLMTTASNRVYLKTIAATTLLATGGFMMMPLGTVFAENNLKIPKDDLWILYIVTGMFSIVLGPLIGKLSDSWGKYRTFLIGSIMMSIIVVIYCNLGATPLVGVMVLNIIMFAGISGRMISSQALISAVPETHDRGAFMSMNSSAQQISGGFAAIIAGMIVIQSDSGELQRYDFLGYVVVVSIIISTFLMWFVSRYVSSKTSPQT
jgi:predicted MFS family arabinose efflux permease